VKKNLEQLLLLIPDASITGERNKIIKAVTHDSRNVVPGTLFICLTGNKVDGHEYIQQAVELGAVAVLVEKQIAVPAGITVIQVENTRTAMQLIVPAFFDYPARELRMIGVTGTNGKTTTTYLVRSILKAAGFKTGVIGTIQTLIEDRVLPVKNTTPDVVELQRTLAEMVDADIDYVIMEVSSHALALDRVAGCEFDIGAFTNITQDHLDFHGTFDRYTDAKAKLFRLLGQEGNIKQGKRP
jgi:UDP-N-acetylmuramyl-tripeptide synthetase